MILPTLVLAYVILALWVKTLVEMAIVKLSAKYPKAEKYLLTATPLIYFIIVFVLVFTLQLLLQLMMWLFTIVVLRSTNVTLIKTLVFDTSR